jgi:ABC-type branched-subunit amino acid transport system substrate-binding protein
MYTGAALLLGALSAACGSDDDSKPTDSNNAIIKLGALADRTGPSKSTSYDNALTLAQTQMNAALEQVGLPIRFDTKVADSASVVTTARDGAIDLINNQGVKGIVSDISADTLAVNSLNYDSATPASYKVPVTCYACSAAAFNDPMAMDADPVKQAAYRDEENWLYRQFFNGKYEASVSARIMLHKTNGGDINNDGNFKVTVYAQNDAFGNSSATSLQKAVEALVPESLPHSVEIIFLDPATDPTRYDWASDIERLVDDRNESADNAVDGKPDAIFLALLPLLATGVVSAYADSGYDVPMQAATAFRRNYILRAIGDKAVGLEGDSPRVYGQDDSGSAYANAYQAANNDIPEMLSAHVYDCLVTLMLASLKASVGMDKPDEVEASAVREQMLSVTDPAGEPVRSTPEGLAQAVSLIVGGKPIQYTGAAGVGPWDPAGDTFPAMVHWTVVNDGTLRFKEEEAYDCSPANPTCGPL